MKKYLYLLSVSLIAAAAGRAEAITAAQQLRETKAIFVADFHKMDDDKDGKLSLDEYLSHQFENFRATIIDAVDFDTPSPRSKEASAGKDKPAASETPAVEEGESAKESADELKSLSDVNNTLQEMADFELEEEEDLPPLEDLSLEGFGEPEPLNSEDVLPEKGILSGDLAKEALAPSSAGPETAKSNPEMGTDDDMAGLAGLKLDADVLPLAAESIDEPAAEGKPAPAEESAADDAFSALDLSVSEEENFQKMMAEINMTPEEKAAREQVAKEAEAAKAAAEKPAARTPEEKAAREKQITFMLDAIKRTLPKTIDEITTWTDIEYKDNIISYVYKAGVDTANFSAKEKMSLQNSIKNEACAKARLEMCPKIKPMFIDEGVNMRIRYIDSRGTGLSTCEFNQETCQ